MTHPQALNAMSIGQMCRGRSGERGVIISVAQKRAACVDVNGTPYSFGDIFYSCTLLGFGKSGGTVYDARIEDVVTEDEYQNSLKKQKEEHHEQTQSTV